MSKPAEKPEVVQLPAEPAPAAPANARRAAAQRVREARDRLTSTSGTRPAFDSELLRQYAQTRMSASFVVMLLVVAAGVMFGFWMQPVSAAAWTCGMICIHAAMIRSCGRFLAEPASLAARGANKLLGYAGLLALAGKPLSSGHRPAQDVNLTRR